MRHSVTIILICGLVGCTGPGDRLVGAWVNDKGIELRVSDALEAEICAPVLEVPVKLAATTIERDAFDKYHVRVGLLDRALNADVPLSLFGSLDPSERALVSVLRSAEYALRFCRVEGEPPCRTLSCDSLIGRDYAEWREAAGTGVRCDPSCLGPDCERTRAVRYDRCEAPSLCTLGETARQILECSGAAGGADAGAGDADGGAGPVTNICEALDAPRVVDCLIALLPGPDTAMFSEDDLREVCAAAGTLESLGVSACDNLSPSSLEGALCATLSQVADDPRVEDFADACGPLARLDDYGVTCCGAAVTGDTEAPVIERVSWTHADPCVPGVPSAVTIEVVATDPDTSADQLRYDGMVTGCSPAIDSRSETVTCNNAPDQSGSVTVRDPDDQSHGRSFTIEPCADGATT